MGRKSRLKQERRARGEKKPRKKQKPMMVVSQPYHGGIERMKLRPNDLHVLSNDTGDRELGFLGNLDPGSPVKVLWVKTHQELWEMLSCDKTTIYSISAGMTTDTAGHTFEFNGEIVSDDVASNDGDYIVLWEVEDFLQFYRQATWEVFGYSFYTKNLNGVQETWEEVKRVGIPGKEYLKKMSTTR